jgi:Uma2 family endonuclease
VGDPPAEVQAWLDRRRALGQDLFDEVWEGEYHVAPAPHRRHGDVDDQLAAILRPTARAVGLWPSGPLNIGAPDDYRVPDRAYVRTRDAATFTEIPRGLRPRTPSLSGELALPPPGRSARSARLTPTAAIVVEIVSPGDETRSKSGFYFAAGVEELLVVDPEARTAEWWSRGTEGFVRADASTLLGLTAMELHAAIDWPS